MILIEHSFDNHIVPFSVLDIGTGTRYLEFANRIGAEASIEAFGISNF